MAIPAMTQTPQTELDAVNQMLLSIGQAPVSTLAVTGLKDVSFAQYLLHQVAREVQLRGWEFNTDDEYPLTPDVDGKIAIPASALKVDPCDKGKRFVERYSGGDRLLYDKDTHSFVHTDPVDVDITWFFPFEELPESARAYIAHRAGRVFQANQVGSTILYQFTKEREVEVLAELERDELQNADDNILSGDPATSFIAHRQPGYRRRW